MNLIAKGSNVFLNDMQGDRPIIIAENPAAAILEDKNQLWMNERIKFMLMTAEESYGYGRHH